MKYNSPPKSKKGGSLLKYLTSLDHNKLRKHTVEYKTSVWWTWIGNHNTILVLLLTQIWLYNYNINHSIHVLLVHINIVTVDCSSICDMSQRYRRQDIILFVNTQNQGVNRHINNRINCALILCKDSEVP